MHTFHFQLKRAHHQSLAFQREQLRAFGITPGRFDFLFAVYRHGGNAYFTDIRIALGCVASNISRYSHDTEKLGWLEADPGARMLLSLTKAGTDLVERILEHCRNAVEGHVTACVERPERPENEQREPPMRFERAHSDRNPDKEFTRVSKEVRQRIRERIVPKIDFGALIRALERIRAVFRDVRLLDIYDPTYVKTSNSFAYLMLYQGRHPCVHCPMTKRDREIYGRGIAIA
jgi:DNA-binding MarR family transcriptional regulator